jgi:thiamine monophosphate kinase
LENENDLENPQLNLIIDEDYYNVLSEYYEQSRSSFEIDFSVLDSLQTDLNDEELLLTTGTEDFELTENLSENEIEFLQNKIKEIKF